MKTRKIMESWKMEESFTCSCRSRSFIRIGDIVLAQHMYYVFGVQEDRWVDRISGI